MQEFIWALMGIPILVFLWGAVLMMLLWGLEIFAPEIHHRLMERFGKKGDSK